MMAFRHINESSERSWLIKQTYGKSGTGQMLPAFVSEVGFFRRSERTRSKSKRNQTPCKLPEIITCHLICIRNTVIHARWPMILSRSTIGSSDPLVDNLLKNRLSVSADWPGKVSLSQAELTPRRSIEVRLNWSMSMSQKDENGRGYLCIHTYIYIFI